MSHGLMVFTPRIRLDGRIHFVLYMRVCMLLECLIIILNIFCQILQYAYFVSNKFILSGFVW